MNFGTNNTPRDTAALHLLMQRQEARAARKRLRALRRPRLLVFETEGRALELDTGQTVDVDTMEVVT